MITGKLYPCDGVEGCTFEIEEIEEGKAYRVTLISPFEHHEIVDQATLKPEEIGPWLLNRQDY